MLKFESYNVIICNIVYIELKNSFKCVYFLI